MLVIPQIEPPRYGMLSYFFLDDAVNGLSFRTLISFAPAVELFPMNFLVEEKLDSSCAGVTVMRWLRN